MKLYAGTTEQFMADTQMHRIAEKLRNERVAQIGYKPGPAEFNALQNSLQALALLISQAKLEDHGVILQAVHRIVSAARAQSSLVAANLDRHEQPLVAPQLMHL